MIKMDDNGDQNEEKVVIHKVKKRTDMKMKANDNKNKNSEKSDDIECQKRGKYDDENR